MKNNPSRDQLTKSLDRRVRHLMIKTLERFEDAFQDVDNTKEGQLFKADIRTFFNDVLRAQRNELLDYEVDYRPLHLDSDNTLIMTQTFMQTVQRIVFDIQSEPSIKIYSSMDKINVLDAIRSEFGTGVIYEDGESAVLEIVGVNSCANSVLLILDRYRLHADIRSKYRAWRSKVIDIYRRQGC